MRLVKVTSMQQPRPKAKKRMRKVVVLMALLLTSLVAAQLLRPLPRTNALLFTLSLPQPVGITIDWPAGAQASIGATGYGTLAHSGNLQPLATASTAKVITALCVLEKYPLKLGESGPLITMSRHDVALYDQQVQQNGSRLPIKEGLQLSEYQALQALMIPSANNIADSLAIWAFGDQQAYAVYANEYLTRNGLIHTHVGNDASGLDPSTVSTADDLTQLALLARKNEVLMQIAGQKTVSFPYAGDYDNYNRTLGVEGINGLKTGNNDENKGALVFTADMPVGDKTVAISGAVMGAGSLQEALDASIAIVASVHDEFEPVVIAKKGQKVGVLKTPWGSETPVYVKQDLSLLRWKETPLVARHTLRPVEGTVAESVGALAIKSGEQQASVTLAITQPVAGPSLWWKLTRLR